MSHESLLFITELGARKNLKLNIEISHSINDYKHKYTADMSESKQKYSTKMRTTEF